MKAKLLALNLALLIFILGSCTVQNRNTSGESTAASSKSAPPKNIILMIGDGMGLAQVSAGMIANQNKLALEGFSYIGLSKTSSSDNLVTDSAAGATALSTGNKTYNGAIGVGDNKEALETILEIAAKKDLNTGLIATSSITHATPASFYAHQPSRKLDEAIAFDMISAPVDLFMGGGKAFFAEREDDLNLLDSLENKGFTLYDDISVVPENGEGKIACFIAEEQPPAVTDGRGDYLVKASTKALSNLDGDKGFFIMIEGSQIDWQSHSNNSDGTIAEMLDFNKAIKAVLDFAKKDGNTLVIVTADHETGGYSIVGGERNPGKVEGAYTTHGHTASMVPVYAYGPGSESFAGIYENTAIFDKMLKLLGK